MFRPAIIATILAAVLAVGCSAPDPTTRASIDEYVAWCGDLAGRVGWLGASLQPELDDPEFFRKKDESREEFKQGISEIYRSIVPPIELTAFHEEQLALFHHTLALASEFAPQTEEEAEEERERLMEEVKLLEEEFREEFRDLSPDTYAKLEAAGCLD